MDASSTVETITAINDTWVSNINGSYEFFFWLIGAFIALIIITLLIATVSEAFKTIFK